jgi:hypothetical protein
MTDKIRNPIDADFEPLVENKTGPVYGLVVGTRKTEAELVACYGGDRRGMTQKILFEDEDGNPEPEPPGTGTD